MKLIWFLALAPLLVAPPQQAGGASADCLPDHELCIPTEFRDITFIRGHLMVPDEEQMRREETTTSSIVKRIGGGDDQTGRTFDRVCEGAICTEYIFGCKPDRSWCAVSLRMPQPPAEVTQLHFIEPDFAYITKRISLRVGRARVPLSKLIVRGQTER